MEAPQAHSVGVSYETTDDGRTIFDLDAYRAAKAERQKMTFIRLGGEEIPLPSADEVPLDLMEMVEEGNAKGFLIEVFGREDGERILATKPSVGDLKVILSLIMGANAGE